ncbi:MAG: hypothetical protein ABSD02_15145 [Steroidobacteraceae bacterium]|jgi:hypothetical protein
MSAVNVLIHVRFSPSGEVTDIGSRPATVASQQWFDYLSGKAGESYQPLSGGRGVFRIPSGELESLSAALAGA